MATPVDQNIVVNESIQLVNPCNKSDLFRYAGPIENFDKFNHQADNYKNIQASLAPFNIQLSFIWVGIFKMNGNRLHFVAKDENNKVFWQKYEGNSKGSGQNYIFINGLKNKTTSWLKMSVAERAVLTNNHTVSSSQWLKMTPAEKKAMFDVNQLAE